MPKIGPIDVPDEVYELLVNSWVTAAAEDYLGYRKKPLNNSLLEELLDGIDADTKQNIFAEESLVARYRELIGDYQRAYPKIEHSEDYKRVVDYPLRELGKERLFDLIHSLDPDHPVLQTVQHETNRKEIDSPDR